MRLSSTILLLSFLSPMTPTLASKKEADWLHMELCSCFGDNFVGWAKEYRYYNSRLGWEWHWVDRLGQPRLNRHAEKDILCADVNIPSTCRSLPDIRDYPGSNGRFRPSTNVQEGNVITVTDDDVIVDGIRTSLNFNMYTGKRTSSYRDSYGHACADVCRLAFGENPANLPGMQPLCNHTYRGAGRYYGREAPFEMVDDWGSFYAVLDSRSCISYGYDDLREGRV